MGSAPVHHLGTIIMKFLLLIAAIASAGCQNEAGAVVPCAHGGVVPFGVVPAAVAPAAAEEPAVEEARKKREATAEAEAEADPEADPWVFYRTYGYWPHGYGHLAYSYAPYAYAFHLLPSGLVHPNVKAVLGNGVVIHVAEFMNEIKVNEAKGMEPVTPSRLKISDRAHLVLDMHRMADGHQEEQRNKSNVMLGTTKKGNRP